MKRNEEFTVGEHIYCSFFFDYAKEGTLLLEKELKPTPACRTVGTTTTLGTFPKWNAIVRGYPFSLNVSLFPEGNFTEKDYQGDVL